MIHKRIWCKLLLIYLFAILLPFLFLTAVVTHILNEQVYQNSSQLIYNTLNTVSVNIDATLQNINYAMSPVLVDSQLKTDLRNLVPYEERKTDDDFVRDYRIISNLYNYATYNTSVLSMEIYSFKGQTLFSTGLNSTQRAVNNNYSLEDSIWYNRYLSIPSTDAWSSIYFCYPDEPQLIRYFPIYSKNGREMTDLFAISISCASLETIIGQQSLSAGSSLFITDYQGNPVVELGPYSYAQYTSNRNTDSTSNSETIRLDGIDFYVYHTQSDFSYLQYTYLVPCTDVNNVSEITSLYSILIFGLMLTILSLAIWGVYRYIVKPVSQLFSAMRWVQDGDFTVRLPEKRQDEIGSINRNFNLMTANLEKLINENYKMKISAKEIELKFILSQINEHFLYNTLDAIHWSARKHQNTEISKVVTKLALFYRNVLSSGQDVIPLEDIAKIVKSYLYIQKFRMQERLTYSMVLPEDCRKIRALKYLFQPLVENAILHGISEKAEGGHIHVEFQVIEGKLRFSVSDNGKGIPHDVLTDLLIDVYTGNLESKKNFALKNINSQLALYYGEKYYLRIESEEKKGTLVWFEIPLD